MTTILDFLVAPFDYGFMRRALVACLGLALSAAPLGVLLAQRRMALMADALSHAILPGVAVAFLFAGAGGWWMGLGGLVAGLVVALAAGALARATALREDGVFAVLHLVSLAIGVMVLTQAGGNTELLHLLFGSVLAVDDDGLILIAAVTTLSALAFAVFYRPIVVEAFDPEFLAPRAAARARALFLTLVVINLVGAFQTLGALMAVGLMIVPAIAARLWSDRLIETWARAKRVVPYVDMPLQHIAQDMLRKMARAMTENDTRALVRRIRAGIPGVAFRTNFIVGFPGETEEHFQTLMRFIEEEPLDNLVVFNFEREPETPSYAMTPRVPINTRRSRRAQLLGKQQQLSRDRLARRIGEVVNVMIDGPVERGQYAARTAGSAFEVDGGVVVEGEGLMPGQVVPVRITGSAAYDLFARVEPQSDPALNIIG